MSTYHPPSCYVHLPPSIMLCSPPPSIMLCPPSPSTMLCPPTTLHHAISTLTLHYVMSTYHPLSYYVHPLSYSIAVNSLNFRYTFLPTTVTCTPACQNGGQCVSRNVCTCVEGYSGAACENGGQAVIKMSLSVVVLSLLLAFIN